VLKDRIQEFQYQLLHQAKKLKRIHFGHPENNLYSLGETFILQLRKDDINERAGSMAFSFTIALFPLILFLLNLVPYLQDFFPLVTTENILVFFKEVLPGGLYEQTEGTIMDIVSTPRQSLLSFGFFFALFASTQGVVSMMDSFNSVYKTKESRGFFKTRIIAIMIVLMLAFTVLLASTVMIFGNIFLARIDDLHMFNSGFMLFLFNAFKFLILLLVFYVTSAFIFRFAPAIHDKWKFGSIGAKMAGLLITLGFYTFTFYLNNFASYNKLYGSIGTFIGLMLWLYITSLIVIICFEMNVSLDLIKEDIRVLEEQEKELPEFSD